MEREYETFSGSSYRYLRSDEAASGKNDIYRFLPPLHQSKVSERIVAALVDYIRSAALEPGYKLPSEKELSSLLQVGNRSLREALRILQVLGLVQSRHGTGWFVGKFEPASSLQAVVPLVESFSGLDVQEIMEIRIIHEPQIARLAAGHITPPLKEQLHDAWDKMQAARFCSEESFRHYDRLFHDTLAEAGGNRMLAMFSSIISNLYFSGEWWNVPRYKPPGDPLNTKNFDSTLAEHQKIYGAVMAGDGSAAKKAMSTHLVDSWSRTQWYLKKNDQRKGKVCSFQNESQ